MSSVNIFLRPFQMPVWLSLIGVTVFSTFVYYMVVYVESNNRTLALKTLSDILLLKICTLCQQGNEKYTTKQKQFSRLKRQTATEPPRPNLTYVELYVNFHPIFKLQIVLIMVIIFYLAQLRLNLMFFFFFENCICKQRF